METAKREMTFLLAQPERRVLRAMAAKVPARFGPNHLSGLGVLAAIGTGAAYALSSIHVGWLWVASLMLVVQWFGDSLDGTLARVRGIERPRYGYYIDHMIDAFSTVVVGLGIGLSPYVQLELALVLVLVYLMLSINVYLESSVFGVFKLAYGKIGPTEGRIILIIGNTALALAATVPRLSLGAVSALTNAGVLVLGVALFVVLTVRFGQNLHRLARLEPSARRLMQNR
jgi:phosphatidylglycerophosphate synthase